MSPQSVPAIRRSQPGRPTRSHEELYDAVEASAARIDDLFEKVAEAVDGLQRLAAIIGTETENEHGEMVRTGIVGKLTRLQIRVDERFSRFDGWIKMGIGFSVAVSIFGPVIWWLIADKVGHVLK